MLRDERGEFHRIALAPDRIRIGRDPDCDLHVDDRSVSRHHARIVRRDGRLVLQDEGSRTGTLLNGARITMATVLAPGDWIRIGHCIALVLDHQPVEADETTLEDLADRTGLTTTDLDATRVLYSVPVVREAARETATAPQLALLETVSDALREAEGIDDVLTVLLGVAFDVLAPERGCVLLREASGGDFKPAIVHPEDQPDFASRTLLDHAIQRRATIVVRNVDEDERFRGVPSLQLSETRAAICCPLVSRDDVVGAIYLDTRFEGLDARREEVALLNFIGCFAATAVENALLLRERSRARTLADLDEDPLVANSAAMQATVARLEDRAHDPGPLLIVGEAGTGKLLAARHVHLAGRGRSAPFLALDCERVSGRDLRKLLVGDDEASTGVWRETARGTLVLEHIGALDLLAQNTLVELLEDGAGPRLICTTSRPLADNPRLSNRLVEALGDASVTLPRLRERKEDILPLARHFLTRASAAHDGMRRELGPTAEATLQAARFKESNVGELRDAIELAVILSDGPVIEAEQVFTGPKTRPYRLEFDLAESRTVRWLLRRNVHELLLVGTSLLFAALIVVCLAWPDRPIGRIANGMIWGLWWPALLLVFVALGRLWCTLCPLSRVARWAQSAFSLGARAPARVKQWAPWIMATGFGLIVWSEHVFHMPDRPFATGIFLATLMVVAVAGAVSMRGEAWCRYACPLGNMAACYSVASTVHVHANPMICQSQCTTHECHKGSAEERGCPVFLHPLYVKDSHFCKLCMACVRNCPNDSAKLWIRPPLQDVWSLAELNPQLLPLALTLFLLAPLLLARIEQPLVFTILTIGLFALAIPLRWVLVRALARDGDPGPAFRVIFALGILAWGPLMAFHLGNVPGLPAVHLHNEVHQAGLVTMSVLPGLQILAILGASLATFVVLGRIRDRARSGSWWPIYLLVVAYVTLSTWLIF